MSSKRSLALALLCAAVGYLPNAARGDATLGQVLLARHQVLQNFSVEFDSVWNYDPGDVREKTEVPPALMGNTPFKSGRVRHGREGWHEFFAFFDGTVL